MTIISIFFEARLVASLKQVLGKFLDTSASLGASTSFSFKYGNNDGRVGFDSEKSRLVFLAEDQVLFNSGNNVVDSFEIGSFGRQVVKMREVIHKGSKFSSSSLKSKLYIEIWITRIKHRGELSI